MTPDVHISKDELDKLRKKRQQMLLHSEQPSGERVFGRKPRPVYPHLKFKPKEKSATPPGVKPIGRDIAGVDEATAKKALRETVQILSGKSPIHDELRRTYELNFAVNAIDTLRQLAAMQVGLSFFRVKGWATFPLVHCVNSNLYPSLLDFEVALRAFYEDNPDSFYEPETFVWLDSLDILTQVFNHFNEHDRNRFAEVTGWILRHGSCDQITLVGHDRRPA